MNYTVDPNNKVVPGDSDKWYRSLVYFCPVTLRNIEIERLPLNGAKFRGCSLDNVKLSIKLRTRKYCCVCMSYTRVGYNGFYLDCCFSTIHHKCAPVGRPWDHMSFNCPVCWSYLKGGNFYDEDESSGASDVRRESTRRLIIKNCQNFD